MGHAFSRLTVYHAEAPRRTSRRSSHHDGKSSNNSQSPAKPQTRRVHSRVTSSSSIHASHPKYFSEGREHVGSERPSTNGTARSSRTQPHLETRANQEEPFTPLPPAKTPQSPRSPRSPPFVESSSSTSSGTSSSDDWSSRWSGPVPAAPIPPNWDRHFYSGISPQHLRAMRSSQREGDPKGIHRNTAPRVAREADSQRHQPHTHHHGISQTPPHKRVFVYPTYSAMVEVEGYPEDLRARPPQSPRFQQERYSPRQSTDPFVGERYVHVWSLK